AVVARPGIALGVLVGERAALGLHDRLADVVLARDHRQRLALAVDLAGERVGDCRVRLAYVLVLHIPVPGPTINTVSVRQRSARPPAAVNAGSFPTGYVARPFVFS